MYKVLALDLDGTVLGDDHVIQPETKAAIQEAKEHCHVVIVTGRHHTAAKPYYYELGLTTPIICCNGTYVYDYKSEQVLAQNAIEEKTALDFIALANECSAKMVMYVNNAMLYSKHEPVNYMLSLEDWAHAQPESVRPKINQIDSFIEQVKQADSVFKFVVEAQPEAIENLLLHPLVQQKFNGERSWSNRIDFAAKGNTKGERLAQYLAQNEWLPHEVMAVGDNHNDISMLRLAGLGVAMANADETVKAQADEVCTTDNNNDGLARLIRNKIKG